MKSNAIAEHEKELKAARARLARSTGHAVRDVRKYIHRLEKELAEYKAYMKG